MAGKPAEPPDPRHRPVGEERADELEHTGPVAIERHVKDDGRALILYFDERRSEDPRPA